MKYRTVDVDGLDVFYREAGNADKPTLLLLHGFPSAGHMFRDLIPRLEDRYHLVAPDLPGFGQTELLPREKFAYTFDNLANVIDRFTEVIGLDKFAIYIFDYGAPVGMRIASRHPERITAIVTQNGNAYKDGFGNVWGPIEKFWHDPSLSNRDVVRDAMLRPENIKEDQYLAGVPDPSVVSPDGYTLDNYYLAREGVDEIQLDLFLDYANNVDQYPVWQEYLRTEQPPVLAVWGRNDAAFIPPGAEAYRRDVPKADIRFLDTGHFALETNAAEVAGAIREFLPSA